MDSKQEAQTALFHPKVGYLTSFLGFHSEDDGAQYLQLRKDPQFSTA